jgi:hypothetical protein
MTEDIKTWVDEFAAIGIIVSWRDYEPILGMAVNYACQGEVITFCDFESQSIARALQSGCDKIAEAKYAIEAQFAPKLADELRYLAELDEFNYKLASKAPERYDYQKHNRVRKKR